MENYDVHTEVYTVECNETDCRANANGRCSALNSKPDGPCPFMKKSRKKFWPEMEKLYNDF